MSGQSVDTDEATELFVNGTLMRGLALRPNLDGAEFIGETRTAARYWVYSIDERHGWNSLSAGTR